MANAALEIDGAAAAARPETTVLRSGLDGKLSVTAEMLCEVKSGASGLCARTGLTPHTIRANTASPTTAPLSVDRPPNRFLVLISVLLDALSVSAGRNFIFWGDENLIGVFPRLLAHEKLPVQPNLCRWLEVRSRRSRR
jgi:hypothetical protein